MKTILLRAGIVIIYCCSALLPQTAHAMENFLETARKEVRLLEKIIAPKLEQSLHGEQPAIANNPHRNSKAFAMHNPGISEGEKICLNNRLPVVKAALEKMLNRSLHDNQVPKIALICSGGGYRAALCTTGSLCGAKKIGLLDAITYITALSGSTWAVAPWVSSGLPIKKFKEYLQDCVAKPFHETTHEERILIANAIAVKKIYTQARTLVDPYSDLLANRLLACMGDARQMIYLSDQAKKIESGAYPYIIYTAIDGREEYIDGQTWFEFTPHTIGDYTNNIHIPTWAYGREFNDGESTNDAPEKPLGYIMGTCGSAFAANIHTILKKVVKNEDLQKKFDLSLELQGKRLIPFWAEVPNYMYNMNLENDETLPIKDHLKFVDAGLDMNLPYPPISGICKERTPDILIFLDASGGQIGKQLDKITGYVLKHKLDFPSINHNNIDKQTISIFEDKQNPLAPIVIYMPRISDQELWNANKENPEFAKYNLSGFDIDYETKQGFCKTKNFEYTPEQSTLVTNQTEFNMRVSKDAIIEAINGWIDRK